MESKWQWANAMLLTNTFSGKMPCVTRAGRHDEDAVRLYTRLALRMTVEMLDVIRAGAGRQTTLCFVFLF